MFAPLVFVMSLFGFAFLVIGERMGLQTGLAAGALAAVLLAALASLGLAAVSSRLERYLGAAGTAGAGGAALRGAALLLTLGAFAPLPGGGMVLAAGFPLGFLLAHRVEATMPARRGGLILARFALAVVFLALAWLVWPPLTGALAEVLGVSTSGARLGVAGLVLLLLLPGGARGADSAGRALIWLILLLAVLPLTLHLALAVAGRGDPLTLEAFAALAQQAPGAIRALALPASTLVAGAAAGYAARGGATMPARAAALGLAGTLALAALVAGAALFAQTYLADIIAQRILMASPGQWPGFLFEDGVRGWLIACGKPLEDAAGLARACPATRPGGTEITFLAALQAPALARAMQLSVLFGTLWKLLPVLLGIVGLTHLMLRGASLASESVLHGVLNPTGLRSWRLAMARLTLIALVGAVLALPKSLAGPAGALDALLAAAAGVAVLAAGVAHWPRRAPAGEVSA